MESKSISLNLESCFFGHDNKCNASNELDRVSVIMQMNCTYHLNGCCILYDLTLWGS